MKHCFKCNELLPLTSFYAHPMMKDGHLNKCKECAKRDVGANYALRREAKARYERERNQRPRRRAAQRRYRKLRKERYPEKVRANQAVNNAVRDGRLIRQPCRICGAKAEGHHHDYSKPLDVDWLCFKHHREIGHGQKVIAA